VTGFVADPGFAREWKAYKTAQEVSDREPLPAEFSWLHPWAGSAKVPGDLDGHYAHSWPPVWR
jgi:hypothetical protein